MRQVRYVDIGYQTVQEFWDEIVLASAGRFKTDPTRAHAMAVAIYVTHFLDWVFHEKHSGEETGRNPTYVAFKRKHHAACPELVWLADLAETPRRRMGSLQLIRDDASALALVLIDGTQHGFAEVATNAVAYWRLNR